MAALQSKTQTAAERRAAETELRGLIDKFAAAHRRLIGAIRLKLRQRLPTAHEVVYEYKDCFVVSFSPSEHGYDGVLAIRASADGVKLYFNNGKVLPDPEKLLRGTATARWISVENAATLSRPAVAKLIDEAIANNRMPFARTGGGSMIVRLTTAKKARSKRSAK